MSLWDKIIGKAQTEINQSQIEINAAQIKINDTVNNRLNALEEKCLT
jgi:hypothetical protein